MISAPDDTVLLDSLKFLATQHRAEFSERRKIEYRVLFATLSFYILSVGSVLTSTVVIPPNILQSAWIGYSALAVITSFFLKNIHRANQRNRKFAQNAEEKLDKLFSLYVFGPTRDPSADTNRFLKPFKGALRVLSRNLNWLWQTLILALFASAASIIAAFTSLQRM